MLLIRIYKVIKYSQKDKQGIDMKDYTVFIILESIKSVADIMGLLLSLILIVLPWRACETFKMVRAEGTSIANLIHKLGRKSRKAKILITQVIHTFIDLAVSPLALLIFCSVYKIPSFVKKLDIKHGTK